MQNLRRVSEAVLWVLAAVGLVCAVVWGETALAEPMTAPAVTAPLIIGLTVLLGITLLLPEPVRQQRTAARPIAPERSQARERAQVPTRHAAVSAPRRTPCSR